MSETRAAYSGGFPSGDQSGADPIGLALRHTWHALMRGALGSDQADALGKQAYWVLFATANGPCRMAALAESSEVSAASLTGIVDRLEERGLIVRTRSSEDRRVVTAEITPAGRERIDRAHAAYRARLESMLEPLTADERDELLRLLSKMNDQKGL